MKRSIILTTINFRDEIRKEINSKSRVSAFLLTHSYIEALLRELFMFSKDYNSRNKKERKTLSKIEEEFKFKTLLNYHFSIKTINLHIYNQISNINKIRNSIAHNLLSYNRNQSEFKELIINSIETGINICEFLQKEYMKRLTKAEALYH